METTGPTVFSRCTRTDDDFKETAWKRVLRRSRTARLIQLPAWYRHTGWPYRLPFPLQAHFTSKISILIDKRNSSTYRSNACSSDSPACRCITSSTGRRCFRVRHSAVAFRSRRKPNGGMPVRSAAACLRPQIFQLQHIRCLQARSASRRPWHRRPFRHRRPPLRLLSRFLRSSGN